MPFFTEGGGGTRQNEKKRKRNKKLIDIQPQLNEN